MDSNYNIELIYKRIYESAFNHGGTWIGERTTENDRECLRKAGFDVTVSNDEFNPEFPMTLISWENAKTGKALEYKQLAESLLDRKEEERKKAQEEKDRLRAKYSFYLHHGNDLAVPESMIPDLFPNKSDYNTSDSKSGYNTSDIEFVDR